MKNGEIREGIELGNGKSIIEYSKDEISEIEATIHFHTLKIWNKDGKILFSTAKIPSNDDKKTFNEIQNNVILGYIGYVLIKDSKIIKPKIGAVFYSYNKGILALTLTAMRRIVNHQHQIRKHR